MSRVYGVGDITSMDKRAVARIAATWGLHMRVYVSAIATAPIEQWFWNGSAWEHVS